MDEQYFKVKEVAKRLGFQEQTIRLEIRDGKLKAIKVRGEYRIAKKDLEAYLKQIATAPDDATSQVAC